jgi:CheY-like chemotaxis protein
VRIEPRPILIVEDDEYSRLMMVTLLDLKGYSVVTAANGAEALRVARQQLPCLILLDLIMPVMDGLQFRAAQLADAALSSIPVVCVSGRYNAADLAREIGAVALIEKPVVVDSLLDAVRQHYPAPAAN